MTQTVAEVVGRNMKRTRERGGLTLDEVAREARVYGHRWNTGRVSRMERGEGSVTVDLLLFIAYLLGNLLGEAVRPADLLRSDEGIQIAPRATLNPGKAAQALEAGDSGLWTSDLVEGDDLIDEEMEQVRARYDGVGEVLRPVGMTPRTAEQLDEAHRAWSLSDERAARKLGLSQGRFTAWSIRLWGRLMSAEVERRSPAGATPQKKGRITRELLAELQEVMSRGDD